MAYTYAWIDPELKTLKRTDELGNVSYVPADKNNRDYAEYCRGSISADPYSEPAPPEPLTAEEKLAASGLTVDELKGLLGLS